MVTLKIICSRKCAEPFVSGVSNRLPLSIQTPTVDEEPGIQTVATLSPFLSVVTSKNSI